MPSEFDDSLEGCIARAESLLSPKELARIQEAERVAARGDALTYELGVPMFAVASAAEAFVSAPDEFVIVRCPWRWKLRGEPSPVESPGWQVIPNAYESFSAEGICRDRGWALLHDFHHVAIVKGARP